MHLCPTVMRENTSYELPGPIVAVRILDSWDFARFKVPMLAGDYQTGHSRNGVDLSIEGQVAQQAGVLKLSEAEMLAELERFRAAVDRSAAEPFDLLLYRNEAGTEQRLFRDCTTIRFEADLSNRQLYTYILTLHAADPALHH